MVDPFSVANNTNNQQKPSIVRLLVERLERRTILAIMAMQAFIFVIFLVIFHTVPTESRDILNMLIGALIMLVKDAFSYDFGSTTSSVSKDDTIKQAALSAIPDTNKDQTK